MKIEYKMLPRGKFFRKNRWVALNRLDMEDIDNVGINFVLRINKKIYTHPDPELRKMLVWEALTE